MNNRRAKALRKLVQSSEEPYKIAKKVWKKTKYKKRGNNG